MNRRTRILALVVVALVAGTVLLAQSNPFVGTWKLNLEKSKFKPGPAPQSQTRTWDASGKVSVTGVGATGKDFSYGYTITGDGKPAPTMGAIPNTADMIITKKIKANEYEATFTKAGKEVEKTTFTVSDGGKTLTIHAIGVPEVGGFENLQVLDKQ